MYETIKRIAKNVKYGSKYGKGLLAGVATFKKATISDNMSFLGQGLGILGFPFLYFIIQPLTRKLPASVREKTPMIFYSGATIGSCLGSLFSFTFMKNSSSSAAGIYGVLIGIVGTAILTVGYELYSKNQKETLTKEDEGEFAATKQRLWLGLELGVGLGAGLGATLAAIHPGLGLIGAAAGSLVGSIVCAGLAVFAPSILNKLSSTTLTSKQLNSSLANILKNARLGGLLGSCIGVVLGTFLFPGLGSVLGGLIGAGIGGAFLGGGSWIITNTGLFSESNFLTKNLVNNKVALSTIKLETKISVAALSTICAIIGTFVLPGIGTAAGAAIGALAGSLIGSLPTLARVFIFKTPLGEDAKQDSNAIPFYKKAKVNFSIGTTVGALIGAVIGSVIPVVGTTLGALIGGLIGGGLAVYEAYHQHSTKPPALPVKPNPVAPKIDAKASDVETYKNVQATLTSTLPGQKVEAPKAELVSKKDVVPNIELASARAEPKVEAKKNEPVKEEQSKAVVTLSESGSAVKNLPLTLPTAALMKKSPAHEFSRSSRVVERIARVEQSERMVRVK